MTIAANVVLAAAELEDDQLLAARLLDDLARDLRARDERLAHRHAAAITGRNEENLVEHDLGSGLTGQLLDRYGLAWLDSILLSTRLDHGVHDLAPREKMLLRIADFTDRATLGKPAQRPSRLCNRSEVITGLARPLVSRMTAPTKKPNSPSLPLAYSSACLGLAPTTRSTISQSAASSEICWRPLRSTIRAGDSPDAKLSANTSLPILPLIVPISTRRTSSDSVAGTIGDSEMCVPFALSAPSNSVSSQFAIVRPELSPGCTLHTRSK